VARLLQVLREEAAVERAGCWRTLRGWAASLASTELLLDDDSFCCFLLFFPYSKIIVVLHAGQAPDRGGVMGLLSGFRSLGRNV
jgi:hypothetical protein